MTDFTSGELERDAALLDRVENGEEAAHGLLYDRHAAVVYGYALRLTGDVDDAADLVCAVFRTVWQQPSGGRSAGLTVRAWLTGLCRQAANERPRQPRLMGGTGFARIGAFAGDQNDCVLPLMSAEAVQRRDRVQTALGGLNELSAAALELVFFDGLSVLDAAQRMGIAPPTARALLSTAMHELRDSLRTMETL
ncbi:MAG: ECF RNA polymerase sigma factor SigL [Gemmatimonadaceae bacterium]|nr:ECF RNA polymerase sigma factor SigL [Gemmatimonadaceae bacterium]